MENSDPAVPSGLSDDNLSAAEARINRVAWAGGIGMLLVTAATLILLFLTGTRHDWQYAAYLLLPGVPLSYAAFSIFVTRRAQLAVLRAYQSELVYKVTDLQEMAYRDELTGLFNRRHFYDVVKMHVEKAHATKRPLALLLMDLDGLKKINDEHGHAAGDQVLTGMGSVIARHVRSNDVPARLGGDEFGIVMPDTDKRGAFALARRLWTDLEETPIRVHSGKELTIAVSIGLAGFPWGGETAEEMMQWADADMYANKVSRGLGRDAAGKQIRTDYPSPDDIAGAI